MEGGREGGREGEGARKTISIHNGHHTDAVLLYSCMYVCVCVYVCMYVCIYVCLYSTLPTHMQAHQPNRFTYTSPSSHENETKTQYNPWRH